MNQLEIHFTPDQVEAFLKYDSENPSIYRMFRKLAFLEIQSGNKHLSADFIWQRIRHKTRIEEKDGKFKLNDKFRSFYSRKFINDYPEYSDFFILRKSKSNAILQWKRKIKSYPLQAA